MVQWYLYNCILFFFNYSILAVIRMDMIMLVLIQASFILLIRGNQKVAIGSFFSLRIDSLCFRIFKKVRYFKLNLFLKTFFEALFSFSHITFYTFLYLSICLSVYLSIYLYIYLSECLSIYLLRTFRLLFIYLSSDLINKDDNIHK